MLGCHFLTPTHPLEDLPDSFDHAHLGKEWTVTLSAAMI